MKGWVIDLIEDYADKHNMKDKDGNYVRGDFTEAFHGMLKEECDLADKASIAYADRETMKEWMKIFECPFGKSLDLCSGWRHYVISIGKENDYIKAKEELKKEQRVSN